MELFDKDIIEHIKDVLTGARETLAVAESVSAGLLQNAFASATDASEFFQGGLTAYNLGQKSRHLLIDPIHALSYNFVSENIASNMALSVCNLFSSDWGIGITGYASPVPESGNKVFCYFAIAFKGKMTVADKLISHKISPAEVQLDYVNQILQSFMVYLDRKTK